LSVITHIFPAMTGQLQQELRQTRPFARPESEAVVGILRTAAVLDHAVNEALKPLGLTATQHNVLRILRGAGAGGLCGREVGERLIARVPDVSRLLDRMVETGLVARERDADDRRHVTARITDAGLALLDRVDPVIAEVEARYAGRLAPEALIGLIDALDAIRFRP
jgi:DNA-binding MarR family transcriptional regulator